MKIQCNACEAGEAKVLCCADEAALCWACDEKIHAANKLASKHQRVPLSSSASEMPRCDICQEAVGYFFCLEDRALLCRKCDVAIHSANSYVSAHQRFLLTGVKVGLEPTEHIPPSSKEIKSNSTERTAETQFKLIPERSISMSISTSTNEVVSRQGGGLGGLPATKASFTGGTTMPGIIPDWPLEEFLGLTGFNQNYGFMEHGSSKADHGKLADSDWSPIYRAASDREVDVDEFLGSPEVPWTVPEIPSPPTASGLYWPKNLRNSYVDDSMSVPDICYSPLQSFHEDQMSHAAPKRRRHF